MVLKNESKKISVDLAEDDVSSSKTNVTHDYMEPVAESSGEKMTLFYELDDEADITVSIHKGTNGTGTKVIELVDDDEQDEGKHKITWDGRDDDNDKLSKGIYSYKITAKNGSNTETETGIFVIGSVGELDAAVAREGEEVLVPKVGAGAGGESHL